MESHIAAYRGDGLSRGSLSMRDMHSSHDRPSNAGTEQTQAQLLKLQRQVNDGIYFIAAYVE